jgi:F-type H+-transporting ATPase subunit epsilon
MATFRLEIVTPEARTFSDDVEMVVLPGEEGEMGILPLHAPLLSMLKPGELRLKKDGQETSMAIGEGFVEVGPDRVSVITEVAIEEKFIDEAATVAAIERAQAALKARDIGSEEVAAIESSITRSLAQLNLKRKRRSH